MVLREHLSRYRHLHDDLTPACLEAFYNVARYYQGNDHAHLLNIAKKRIRDTATVEAMALAFPARAAPHMLRLKTSGARRAAKRLFAGAVHLPEKTPGGTPLSHHAALALVGPTTPSALDEVAAREDSPTAAAWRRRLEPRLARAMSASEIASELGCSVSAVHKWRRLLGLPRPRKAWHDRAIALHHQGLHAREIASRVGSSDQSVRRLLRSRGLPAHPRAHMKRVVERWKVAMAAWRDREGMSPGDVAALRLASMAEQLGWAGRSYAEARVLAAMESRPLEARWTVDELAASIRDLSKERDLPRSAPSVSSLRAKHLPRLRRSAHVEASGGRPGKGGFRSRWRLGPAALAHVKQRRRRA